MLFKLQIRAEEHNRQREPTSKLYKQHVIPIHVLHSLAISLIKYPFLWLLLTQTVHQTKVTEISISNYAKISISKVDEISCLIAPFVSQ